ncbi:MAG: hypothetical protein V3S69_06235, partial [Dehalococcoidales bacterium]
TNADISGLVESSLRMYYWDGTAWAQCSDSGVDSTDINGYSGFLWAKLRGEDTDPDLSYLMTSSFASVASPVSPTPAPSGGGGGGGAPLPLKILTMYTLGGTSEVQLKSDGTLLESFSIADPSGNIIIGLASGTKILCTDDQIPQRLEVKLSQELPPLPEGFAAVSPVYDLIAYIPGPVPDRPEVPQPVTFDPPITLQINYDPEELPENVKSIFIAYYDEEEGWTQLEQPSDFVAAVGTAGAQVSHFTSFIVMTDLLALPALFEVRNLDINPIQVTDGEKVTISAILANIGGLRGEYNLMVNIEGLLETSQVIRLTPGQSQVITFTVTPGSPGNYQVEIGDSRGDFGVEAIPVEPAAGVTVSGWLIAIISAMAVIAALAIIARKKGLQPALAVEAGVNEWLLPGMSAGAAVAASVFTTAIERLQRAAVLKKPSKPAIGAFHPSNVSAVAASAFITARERLQRATALKKPSQPDVSAFRVSNLRILPGRVSPNRNITIIVEAANIGPDMNSYSLVLKIKGMVEAVKEITLDPGQSQKVAFAILRNKPGIYDVDLEGLKGSFTVEEADSPPDSSLSKRGNKP